MKRGILALMLYSIMLLNGCVCYNRTSQCEFERGDVVSMQDGNIGIISRVCPAKGTAFVFGKYDETIEKLDTLQFLYEFDFNALTPPDGPPDLDFEIHRQWFRMLPDGTIVPMEEPISPALPLKANPCIMKPYCHNGIAVMVA